MYTREYCCLTVVLSMTDIPSNSLLAYNESIHSSYDTYREGTSGNLGDAVDGEGSYLGGGEGSNL